MESTEAQQTSATTSLNNISIVTFSTSTTSMMSTPVSTSQSTGSNTLIIAAVISTVFILLVVTILVILIVSILVCRRRWYKTSNGNDTFSSTERKADIDQQSESIQFIAPRMNERQNTLKASTNLAYGVTGGQESKIKHINYQVLLIIITS